MVTQKIKVRRTIEKDPIAKLTLIFVSIFKLECSLKLWLMPINTEVLITGLFIHVQTVVETIYYVYIFCNIS